MLSKNEIKDIQSLRHKKFRDAEGLFVAEGPKIIYDLLTSSAARFKKIYALKSWLDQHQAVDKAIPVQEISEIELDKISQLQSPNEVVGVLHQFDSFAPQEGEFILYLDGIQDPGNLGTIIRIADWFGVKNIVSGEGCADLYNSKVVQATMASLARVNVFYELDSLWLQKQTIPKYAATLDGISIHQVQKPSAGILIIGNESKGIRADILEQVSQKITIPKIGEAESLNAAVATGILLSHLLGE